jgi:polyphosphate glucokinase
MVSPRVREAVAYPLEPAGEDGLVQRLVHLASELPAADRVSVGFPGRTHKGHIVTGHKFTARAEPGSDPDPELVLKWRGFDLTAALTEALGLPVRVVNDADMQGLAAVSRDEKGLSIVLTLGTGFGSALFEDGVLLPHMEFAHHVFRKGESYEEQIGEAARLSVGDERWNRRVAEALESFDALCAFDKLYLGGGNAKRVAPEIIYSYEDRVQVVDNKAGIIGGERLWEMPEGLFR